jgi:hypothetical protein
MARQRGFERYQGQTAEAIDVSAADFSTDPVGIFYVRASGGTGDVAVVTADGTTVTIKGVGDVEYIPIAVKTVLTSGTTYSGDLLAIY